jgi:hypothetical protein
MTRLLSALVALALALVGMPPAATAQTNAPPGNSAIDEYLETVPSATGNQRPRTPGSDGSDGTVLTAAQRNRLENLGPDGKTLVDAVDATSPPPASKSARGIHLESAEGRSPINAVLDAATGQHGGGMGFMLPVILVASLLGVIALIALRRRSMF